MSKDFSYFKREASFQNLRWQRNEESCAPDPLAQMKIQQRLFPELFNELRHHFKQVSDYSVGGDFKDGS